MEQTRTTESGPVALLVVHGIGSQKRGETLASVLDGLEVAYGEQLQVQREDEDYVLLNGLNRPIHIFEVYWADLLKGETVKGTFEVDRIFEAVWFPLYNYKSGLFSNRSYSRAHVLRWTWLLAPLSAFLATGIRGAQFLGAIPSGIIKARQDRDRLKDSKEQNGSFWDQVQKKRTEAQKENTFVDNILDQVVGDVFNYVYGVARAFPEMKDKNEILIQNVDRIHARFQKTVQRAINKGCREIQVLAHSLGTVVAFNSMCSGKVNQTDVPAHISRLYTIGSPLEKIRFFWPRLLEHSSNGPAIASADSDRLMAAGKSRDGKSVMKWDNFFNRNDLVSGYLNPFDGWPKPTNHKAKGLGGMIRSHGSYNRNPDFLALLGEGLTGEKPKINVSRFKHLMQRFVSWTENLLLPAVLFFFALLGLVFMVGLGGGTGWVISQPINWLGFDSLALGIRTYFLAVVILGLTVLPIWVGRRDARSLHNQFWIVDKSEEEV